MKFCALAIKRVPAHLQLMRAHLCTDLHEKFHEDPNFHCRDICKTILTFVYSLIFYAFCIFSIFLIFSIFSIFQYLSTKVPLKMEKQVKLLDIFRDTISKCPTIIKRNTPFPPLRSRSYPSPSIELKLLVYHYESPCRLLCL